MRPSGNVRLRTLASLSAASPATRARVRQRIDETNGTLVICYQQVLTSAERPPAQRLAVRFDVLEDGRTADVQVSGPLSRTGAGYCFEHAFTAIRFERSEPPRRARFRASFDLWPGPLHPVRMIQ
jgi:hypothetical protein